MSPGLSFRSHIQIFALIAATLFGGSASASAGEVTVGSKAFTEGYLLGELAAQTLEEAGFASVARKFGLGNTGVTFAALTSGEIALYPEYTGTISEAILHDPALKRWEDLRDKLKAKGLVISSPLGFNNTYALAVRREYAERHRLKTIGDLRGLGARAAFSHEFITRADGLPGLSKRYALDFGKDNRSLEHALAFRALEGGQADVIDVYSTDAKIESMDLVVLEDDLKYFPVYQAVFLASEEFTKREPRGWAALEALKGSIDEKTMRTLNARAEISKESFQRVIAAHRGHGEPAGNVEGNQWRAKIWRRTQEHLFLVGVALLAAVLTGVPLGILSARRKWLGHILLGGASVIQTVPSLALLCLLIPVFGIGLVPAMVALYLYSLLPVVLNTFVGLRSVDRQFVETARALGLGPWRTLTWVELPLAARAIVAGVKTSAVIGIGTATLAALIGAGGYGALIVTGLAINDVPTILAGAVPAAVLALIANFVFILIEKFAVPR